MLHPLTRHVDPKDADLFRVKDADGVFVGVIQRGGDGWRNFHVVDGGGIEPTDTPGPFPTVDAAFAAFETTPDALD